MRQYVFIVLFLMFSAFAGDVCANIRQDLDSLDYYISIKQQYDEAKDDHILLINNQLRELNRQQVADYDEYYNAYNQLFDEYKSYIYDSAHVYVEKLYETAVLMRNKDKIANAQIKKGFVYLSSGLFKECSDLFENLDVTTCNDSIKVDYYVTYARLCYDLGDYNNSDLTRIYQERGIALTNKALRIISPTDTAAYWANLALKEMKSNDYPRAIERFKQVLEIETNTDHQNAIFASSIAYLYELLNNREQAKHYMALAAIFDIKSSTKEAVALRNLAQMLYQDGDIEHAAPYIRYALDDAQFYNARHRQLEISQILPIIEQEQMNIENKQKNRIYRLSLYAYCLLVVLFVALLVLWNRLRALNKAKQTIQNINGNLLEANKIKEEAIGAYFGWQSDYINQLDSYQKYVRKKAGEKKFDELQTIPANINANKKREELYTRFDEMFLKIFPNFVNDFNALLKDDEQIVLKNDELLNIDLRIYALIRLGITDNEKIAQALDYSVNTIYTYKTKIRNRSKYTAAEFKQKVMAIKSFSQSEN